jgi:tetratricopeptide (TPR) repeat protein
MSTVRSLKQRLSTVSRLWDEAEYDEALVEVEKLLADWPGNAHLHVLWASLVQLQDEPEHELDEAKQALQTAVELDKSSPEAAIELGHFLDNVEDNAQAAIKSYAEGVAIARRLLIEGLIGQAKAYRQLNKKEDFQRCLMEILHLTGFETTPKKHKTEQPGPDVIIQSTSGNVYAIQLKGPYAEQVQDLLSESASN